MIAHETEIKLKISDLKAFRRVLKRLGAKPATGNGRVHEENVIFDTPEGGLAKHGQLLRIRTETIPGTVKKKKGVTKRRVMVTFKRPVDQAASNKQHYDSASKHKVREEIELEVTESASLTKIFEGLGMRGWFKYEKYRSTFKLPLTKTWAKDLLIELDETPIGTFVELEGPPQAIDRAAQELGFSRRDYVLRNYLSLYVDECRRRGEQPRDMVFHTEK